MYASVVTLIRGYEARMPGTKGEIRRMGRDDGEAMYRDVVGVERS